MFSFSSILFFILLYIGFLFLIALWAEYKTSHGNNITQNSIVYSLSLAIYCSTWTFYGSVGSAAKNGLLYTMIYSGPILLFVFGWKYVRKIALFQKKHQITSIADLLAVQYDYSKSIGTLVALIVVVGITPYIALQLKSMIVTVALMTGHGPEEAYGPMGHQVAPIIVVMMIMFTIIFGLKKLNSTEKHSGIMAALACESLIKLSAAVLVGIFITFFLFNGYDDILSKVPFKEHMTYFGNFNLSMLPNYLAYTLLSLTAIIFLPRQFQVTIIENSNDHQLKTARWLFPLYLVAINFFVLPIALAGLASGRPLAEADSFLLSLPLITNHAGLSILVFLGGISAGTGMIIVETMAVSIIITNYFLLPIFEKFEKLHLFRLHILNFRWAIATLFILVGYVYERILGASYSLNGIGITSFAAILQIMPASLCQVLFKRTSKRGALLGMSSGFAIWAYTRLGPEFTSSIKEISLATSVFCSLGVNIFLCLLGSFLYPDRKNLIPPLPVSAELRRTEIETILNQYFPHVTAKVFCEKCFYVTKTPYIGMLNSEQLQSLNHELELFLSAFIGTTAAHSALVQKR